jgi:uncharacterized protein
MKIIFKKNISQLYNQIRFSSKYYILFYKYIPDILEKRGPLRPKHLELVKEYDKMGYLLLGKPIHFLFIIGGAYNPASEGGQLLFKASNKEVVEDFTKKDPYVQEKLVEKWEIKEWTVVAGSLADEKLY